MHKYEYLTGGDLGLKPNTVKQAKFQYSSLGKVFNKGLKEEDKKRKAFEETRKYWNKSKTQ